MAAKTILLKGMTAAAIGAAGTEGAVDITEKVLGVNPEIGTTVNTERFFSSIAMKIVEGKAKYLLTRKSHINQYNTTQGIYEAGSVGNEAQGDISTTKYTSSKRDTFTFELNKSWDAGKAYDKKKDPKVLEGELINDLGSLQSDVKEEKVYSFYAAIDADVADAADSKSTKFATYVSSRDEKTKAAPKLVKEVSIKTTATTLDAKKLESVKLVDAIVGQVNEINLFGKKGSEHDGYPYARGTKRALGLEIVVNNKVKEIVSLDPRFIPTGSAEEVIRTGIIGMLANTPVTQDDDFETNSSKDYAILPKGKFGVVIVGEELADEFLLFDHPTKPTRVKLLEGSGAWDTAVTPYINLARFGKIKEVASR